MARDLLIVEDDRIVLDSYGTLVKMTLGIEPFLAETPEDALKVLKNYHIKVLVTDYDMFSKSKLSGVDLVKIVKGELKLNIQFIMLTGYVTTVNAQDAVRAGFLDIIDKRDAENKLIPAIRQALAVYEMISRSERLVECNDIIWSKKKLVKFGEKVDLKLLRISSIEDFTFDQWVPDYIAEKGVNKTFEKEVEYEVDSSIEYGFDEKVLGELGFDSSKIIDAIQLKVETSLSSSIKSQFRKKMKHRAKYLIEIKDLSNESDIEGLILQSRHFESTPVYKRINCVLQIYCTFCGVPRILDLSIIVPTNKIALRQVEYYNKGVIKTIYTGSVYSTICDVIIQVP